MIFALNRKKLRVNTELFNVAIHILQKTESISTVTDPQLGTYPNL